MKLLLAIGIAIGAAVAGSFTALMRIWKIGPFLDQPEDPIDPLLTPVLPVKIQPMPQAQKPGPVAPPTPLERLYEAAKANIGRHLTLDASVPADVGCVEAVSTLLKLAGHQMPPKGLESVRELIAWMLAQGFVEMPAPLAGCVITAHSANPVVTTGAHCGVVMQHGVCSNDSNTGIWAENYSSVQTWRAYFRFSTTRYFRPV